jgi:Putative MetA-pathway of phenol degradation
MPTIVTIAALIFLGVSAGEVHAIDHGNLDENHPLRLEDAYPIASGEVAVEAGGGLALHRGGPSRGRFPVEMLYGARPNLQLGIGSILSTDPREIDHRPKSGDLRLSALYNFNQETIGLPAFAVKVGLDAPTGVNASGYVVGLKGIVTKSIERVSVHLNAGCEFLAASRGDERDRRYEFSLGASYPIGAPRFTRATLIADVFGEQPARRHDATTVGTEAGLRYQLTARTVWDLGLGTEFAGPRDRSEFLVTTGVSFSF